MLKQIQDRITQLMNIGVRDKYSTVKANRIQIANAFFVISAPLIIFNTISNIIEQDSVGFTIDMVLAVIISAIPIFNKYGRHQLVYGYTIFLTTIITNGLFILFGSMVSIAPIYMLGILVTVFCYDKFWTRAFLILFVFANYFYMQEFYLPNHEAIVKRLGDKDYADHLYFVFSIIAVSGITIRVLNQNKEVLSDNEKQLEATQKLNKQLEEKNHELERFAYISSHDLKEPLRNITSFSHLLDKHLANQNDTTSQEYLKYITENAIHMNELVNSIADFMNISNKKEEKQEVNLNDVLNTVIKGLAFKIDEKKAEIHLPFLPSIYASAAQTITLFLHLIENGLKYNQSKIPIIRIQFKEEDFYWLFSVQDNGIGILPQFAEQVFSPFKKLHHKATYEGAGIGLAICKKIVEYHNGKIWIESKESHGTTFYFTIAK